MSWVAVGVGVGGGALLGALKSQQEQRNQKAAMMANAAQIENSPWTGMKTNVMGPTASSTMQGAIETGLQGGMAGALVGQQLKKPVTPNAPEAATGGLGSTDYARQLGAQADQFQVAQMQANPSAYAGLQMPTYSPNRKLAGYP